MLVHALAILPIHNKNQKSKGSFFADLVPSLGQKTKVSNHNSERVPVPYRAAQQLEVLAAVHKR